MDEITTELAACSGDSACQSEQRRLASLDRYDVLDTPPEEAFDRITRLVCRIFDVPMATVTLIDGHRQWFKSRQGLAPAETARGPALCNTVVQERRPLVVPDTLADERFRSNPFVTGEPYARFYAGMPLTAPDGHVIGTLCAIDTRPHRVEAAQIESLRDLAAIVMSELELRTLAATDALTGALSRRAFRSEGARAVALAVRHRTALSCVVFDLDHFKEINDTRGHSVGDEVLAGTVATCRAILRKSDLLGRTGGEEFALLLPHTGLGAAMDVAEKLRLGIEAQRIGEAARPVTVTASFGVVAMDRSASDIDTLLRRADAALYLAKAEGWNRCRLSPPMPAPNPSLPRRVFKAGRISFNTGRSTMDCTVRSLSDANASFDVISSAGVPEQFKLHIESDGFSRLCRVVTKTDKHIGVRFE